MRRSGRTAAVFGLVVGVLVLLVSGCAPGAGRSASPSSSSSSTSSPFSASSSFSPSTLALPAGADHRIVRVVDGDTVEIDGEVTVRLIGVDTPETQHPSLGVQCYGREATAYTEQLLPPGTEVRVVTDVERVDRYGRTLAYLYRRDDALFVNRELVDAGYAQVATFPPNVAHVDELLDAQRAARSAERGLWQACPDDAATTVVPDSVAGACDPSYPSACVPPAPPDLDCADLAVRDLEVRPPDPHRLDGDGDGVGCNS